MWWANANFHWAVSLRSTMNESVSDECSTDRFEESNVVTFLSGLILGILLSLALVGNKTIITGLSKFNLQMSAKNPHAPLKKSLEDSSPDAPNPESPETSCGTDQASQSSLDSTDENYKVLEGALKLFTDQMKEDRRINSDVVNYLSPDEMISKIFASDSPASMNLDQTCNDEQMIECFRNIQKYSVNTNHPYFFNQLFGALDPVALASEIIALSLNTSAYTYETAPVFTMIEREVFANLGGLVFGQTFKVHGTCEQKLSEICDGQMLPGGSLSNLASLHVARHYAKHGPPLGQISHSNVTTRANTCVIGKDGENCSSRNLSHQTSTKAEPELVAFVSSEAHYSFKKAAMVAGISTRNLVIVPTLPNGQIDVKQLDLLLAQVESQSGRIPFFVGLTAGSTVRGSFDDIEAVVNVCRKYEDRVNNGYDNQQGPTGSKRKIFIHVDGAWGGSAIFSSRRDMKLLFKGLEHVDSFTFNPHKMLGSPQQTAAFITRHRGILDAANSCGAKYLFDPRKNGAQYDLGDASYMCGRRTDAVKLWALWKYHGSTGIGKLIDQKADALQLFTERVRQSKKFMLACQSWPFNVNFFYLPKRLRERLEKECGEGITTAENPVVPHDISLELTEVSVQLKLRLHQSGEMFIPYQPISNQKADCFRIVLAGYKKSFNEDEIANIFDLMDKYGHDL